MTILETILIHLQRLRANTCSEGVRNHHSKETGKKIKSHRLKGNSRVNLIQPSTQRRDNVDQVTQGLVQSSFEYLQDRRFHQLSGHFFQHLITVKVIFFLFIFLAYIYLEFAIFQLVPNASHPPTVHLCE